MSARWQRDRRLRVDSVEKPQTATTPNSRVGALQSTIHSALVRTLLVARSRRSHGPFHVSQERRLCGPRFFRLASERKFFNRIGRIQSLNRAQFDAIRRCLLGRIAVRTLLLGMRLPERAGVSLCPYAARLRLWARLIIHAWVPTASGPSASGSGCSCT